MKINLEIYTWEEVPKIVPEGARAETEMKRLPEDLLIGSYVHGGGIFTQLRLGDQTVMVNQLELYAAVKAIHVSTPMKMQEALEKEFAEQGNT